MPQVSSLVVSELTVQVGHAASDFRQRYSSFSKCQSTLFGLFAALIAIASAC